MTASTSKLLTARELEILTAVGYLVLKWNYAEHCARQILRKYIPGGSIDDPEHLKLSRRMARWIEEELRDVTLPKWSEPGRKYLERLVECYAIAREHRNQIVHGIWTTADTGGPGGATAVLVNSMPVDGKAVAPKMIVAADLRPITDHFSVLAVFAQNVMVAFDNDGARALNKDGTPVLDPLPALIASLAPCSYDTV